MTQIAATADLRGNADPSPSQVAQTGRGIAPAEQEQFFREAKDWEARDAVRAERSERRAWMYVAVLGFVAVAQAVTLGASLPFKRAVPYVFTVDKSSGNVEHVAAVDDRTTVGYQELLDKHWAERYVVARESYYWKLLQSDYDWVLGFSSDEVGREFAHLYEGETARDKKYGQGIDLRVRIISVTLTTDAVSTKAVVRFEKSLKRVEAIEADPPQSYVATIAYEYKPSMFGKEVDLIRNPLGYRVVTYRVDAEVSSPSGQGTQTGAR